MSNEDAEKYCNCMVQIRQRIGLAQSVLNRRITTGQEVFDIELIFLQFRKVLELIAFSSLTANKDKYSAGHASFDVHWKAKSMLQAVGKLNPNFYPVPLVPPESLPNRTKLFTPLVEGFLTKEDFEFLYDKSSEVLHVRNPFATKDPVIQIRYTASEWIVRIQKLLAFHNVELVDESRWMVEISNDGPVKLWPAVPTD